MKMKEMIENIIRDIKTCYNDREYTRITNDTRLKKVPDKIWKLWYSDGDHSIAFCNMDYYYRRYCNKEISAEKMYELVAGLKNDFDMEFKRIQRIDSSEEGI